MKLNSTFLCLLLLFSHPGFTADINNLFSAAILGKAERMKYLLADGADVNGKTATGRTAMMGACFNGNYRIVRILLSYGADVNLADNLGTTALMDAVTFGNEKLVSLLLTAGAKADAVDVQNTSVIGKAKKTQYKNIVKLLEKSISKQKTPETKQAVPDDKKTTKKESE